MSELRREFHDRLGELQASIGEMGGRLVESIRLASDAVLVEDAHNAATVDLTSYLIHVEYARLETRVFDLLARQSPVASDLRFVVGSLRVCQEIRRSADLVHHIASFAATLQGSSVLTDDVRGNLGHMADQVVWMFDAAMRCYVVRDADLAAQVVAHDEEVDRLYADTFDRLIRPGTVDKRELILVALMLRYLERLGDHAEVIADRVRFVREGMGQDELDIDLSQLPKLDD